MLTNIIDVDSLIDVKDVKIHKMGILSSINLPLKI